MKNKKAWYILCGSFDFFFFNDVRNSMRAAHILGIPNEDIHLFLTHENECFLTSFQNEKLAGNSVTVHNLADFAKTISLHHYEEITTVICGHGNIEGLKHFSGYIRPSAIIEAYDAIKGLRSCAFIIASCYAGIYGQFPLDSIKGREMLILGACDLTAGYAMRIGNPIKNHKSLFENDSSYYSLKDEIFGTIYLQGILQWLCYPKDLDQSGFSNLLEAHFHASKLTDSASNHMFEDVVDRLFKIKAEMSSSVAKDSESDNYIRLKKSYQEELKCLVRPQTAWISDKRKARNFIFEINNKMDAVEDVDLCSGELTA